MVTIFNRVAAIAGLRIWRNRWILVLLGAVCLAGPVFAEGATSRFRMNVGTEPPTLDPSLATDGTSILIIENLMEGLTQFGRDLSPRPAVAAGWEVSPDGRTYRFHLRKNVLWSDGRRVTARDFEYSWKRLLDPATSSEYAYFLFDVLNAEDYNRGKLTDPEKVGVRAIDDATLEVRLARPVVYFPSLTTFSATFPLRKDLIDRFSSRWTDPGNLVVDGPYRLTEWKHEYKLSLAANPYYYGDRPECREVELYVINEKSTALTLYESGGLDLVSLPPEAIPHYRGTREYINQPELRGYYYGFNVRRPPFNDVRVRKAFSLAIDREQFPRILKGGEKPARSWIPPGLFGYDPEIGLRFNPAEAVRLLAEAGFPGGKGFPDVTLAFNTDAVNSLIAENVQAQIKKNLNIVLRLDNMEWKVYLKRLQLDPPPLFRLGWGADFPDPDNFMNLFLSGGGNNHTGWADPAYDLLVSRGAYEADPERRTRIYHDAQVLLTEREIPIMPLFVSAQNFLLRDGIEGLETNPMELIFFKKIRVVR